jgi:adenine-specific DNA-methyltransferase
MGKFDSFTREELIKLIQKQDDEIKNKEYGLVWDKEKEPEKVVLDCENNLPILKRIKEKEIKTNNSDDNILIEGDNYHALSVLNYTHKGKIDVIYIDPPYNTGARDWKYNNNYVTDDDGYRHSKWLNMMEKRLELAKNLLKEDGIICVTIDDYELPNLWLLMNKIFKRENHLGTVTIRNYPSGRKTKRKLAQIHEYGLFFGRTQKSSIKNIIVDIADKSHSYIQDKDGTWYSPTNLRKQGIDSNAKKEDGSFKDRYYPIYFDPISGKVSTKNKYSIEIWPIDPKNEKRIWRRSSEVIDEMYESGDLWCKHIKNNGYQIYYKFKGGTSGEPPKSIWYDSVFSASEYGTRILMDVIGEREKFEYPKSLYAVMESIKVMSDNKNSIILDFFAGSGTTGQAVLELNQEDAGNRKFILCTNNENNICEEVTYQRIRNVINGYNFKGKEKKTLIEQKLTFSSLKNIDDIFDKINKVIDENKSKFDKIEKNIENNSIKIVGIKNIDSFKDGLGGNLQYFKTELIPVEKINKINDKQRHELTEKAGQMIAIKENTFEEIKCNNWYQIFESRNKARKTAIYFREDMSKFEELIESIKDTKTVLYIFSYGRIDKKLFKYLDKNITIEDIPEPILEIYKEINLTNKK